MELTPIEGKSVRFPPGRVEIRLTQEHRKVYRGLYRHYQSILASLPVLRDRDFDGRPVRLTTSELEALNGALFESEEHAKPGSAFESQEAAKSRLFKRLQYLS